MEGKREIRIVGRSSEEAKEKIQSLYRKRLFDHVSSLTEKDKELIKKYEIPKTDEEIALISLANKETNLLTERLGLEKFDISPDNIHIIDEKIYRESVGKDTDAVTRYHEQAIVANSKTVRESPVLFSQVMIHEMLHLKSHLSLQVEEKGEEVERTIYRSGVTSHSSQKKAEQEGGYHKHFNGLHEAIVSLQDSRSLRNHLNQRN